MRRWVAWGACFQGGFPENVSHQVFFSTIRSGLISFMLSSDKVLNGTKTPETRQLAASSSSSVESFSVCFSCAGKG